ncbi:hypothetical protein AQS8620_00984 [Aquimixticola soesokkakensis]|uniref:DUF3422 domain-containing protein n=1 Tax=Aquimixticola soesokkakensis TaxID=1519096 RepID=A0A1Y5S6M0_9RHOB|nr:DUF3422 domain-containing protein [Aquimixticola soesokkakensis]SLN30966.1 hypothetical protein AQS8620_00984 [Aquimixticola soesokkakensis]
MTPIDDHPRRYALANELHARPFPKIAAPARAVYLALRASGDAARRDRALDHAHLVALLTRFGATPPPIEATHWSGQIGTYHLKWESHTEFVTYMVTLSGKSQRSFDARDFEVFPEDWLATAPGQRIASAHLRIDIEPDKNRMADQIDQWFESESLAVSEVLEGALVIASDFRLDTAGHTRFAVFPDAQTGANRIGRVVQRLCEIETYKTMSMLGLVQARKTHLEMAKIEGELAALIDLMTAPDTVGEADALADLLALSAQIEKLVTKSSFRFGATGAYEAIVTQRIEVLQEARFLGRQTFGEFMLRRYDPAMRTVTSTNAQLASLAQRAARAADLLRTKVDVARQAQNQALLASMDRRADLQLQLQETVEGLSVVAISYYALNLLGYLTYPLVEPLGLSKGLAMAGLTPFVVLAVWLGLRRMRKAVH